MANNREAKLSLHDKYGSECQLSGLALKINSGTFHHLNKEEDGGLATIDNGALLAGKIHSWLHTEIEHKDAGLYHLINDCLILYKYCLDSGLHELARQFQTEVQPEVVENQKQKKLSKKNNRRKDKDNYDLER